MSPRQSRHTGRQAGQPRPLPDLPGARPRALREGPRQRPTARAPPGLRKRRAARQRRRRPARPSPLSPLDQRAAPVQALRLRPAAAGRRLPAPARAQGCPPTSPAHLTRAALRARTRRLSRRTQDTHLALAHLASHKSSAPHSRAAGGVAQAERRAAGLFAGAQSALDIPPLPPWQCRPAEQPRACSRRGCGCWTRVLVIRRARVANAARDALLAHAAGRRCAGCSSARQALPRTPTARRVCRRSARTWHGPSCSRTTLHSPQAATWLT